MQFTLPELGEGVHEGELVKWKVKQGDQVQYDQPLCEIMTDKATVEIPSAFQGKVADFHAKEGQIVKVGQLMLTFEGKEVSAKAGAAGTAKAGPTDHAPSTSSTPLTTSSALSTSSGLSAHSAVSIAASPSTRRYAREMGVELRETVGTGPSGRILREDIDKYLSGSSKAVKSKVTTGTGATLAGPITNRIPREGGEERVPFAGLRKKISEKMRLSKDKAAHFTYVEEADATALVKLRAQAKELGEKQGIKVTYLPFVMKAMVAALKQFPILNASLHEETAELIYKHYYNIGLSIQTEEGLTAPVVKDVGNKSVLELARDIQDLVDRARKKRLTIEDFSGGTITLTNAGSIGGLFATPIINYPEVAILGFNKIFRKPVVKVIKGKEKVVVRDWTYFSISLDHRVVDGAIGAEFMKLFIQFIENPGLLILV